MTQQMAEGSSRGLPLSGERAQGRFSARANSKGGAIVRQNLINHRSSPGRRTSSPSPVCLLPGKLAAGHVPSPYLLPRQLFGNRWKTTSEQDTAASATAFTTASESSDAVIEPSREATDADGRSQAQSFTGSSSINCSGNNECRENDIRGQGRDGGNRKFPHVWEARSRLPFHRLPFEVQAYHLQQHHHHHRQQSHNHRCGQLSSEVSRAENPCEEDGADPAAIAESEWFPLMPPALAGESLPSSGFVPSNKQELLLLGQKRDTFFTGREELEISNSHISQFYTEVHSSSSSTSRNSSSVDGATNTAGDGTIRSSAAIKEKEENGGVEADIVDAETAEDESGKEEAASPGAGSREAPSWRRSKQRASDSE